MGYNYTDKMRICFRKGVVLVFLLVILLPLLKAGVETELNIENSPPLFSGIIPNQSWMINGNLLDAFDLDNFFVDYNGDPINYSYSGVQNITILIDSSNFVSFYSDTNFVGVRNVTFYASDGILNASSNLVYLTVGIDTEPPQWSSPAKNKVTIYQSAYVNFTTTWTDDFGLVNYTFSINQGSGWVNYSQDFSGVYNASLYEAQISAPGGTLVSWRFCAFDVGNNVNCTFIFNFTVSSRPAPPVTPTPPSFLGGEGLISIFKAKKIRNFTLDPEYFLISLKQDSIETRILKITNIGSFNLSFNLLIEGLEEFVVLSDDEFVIPFGETKEITIDFTAGRDTFPDQYFGKLIVESSSTQEVPIVIEVNALEVEFDVDVKIPEKYKRVKPGRIVKADITIQNLKDIVPADMIFYIALKDFYGNIYDSSEEVLWFDSSLSLERDLVVPSNAREGEYMFYARASTKESCAIDSDVFEVGSRFLLLASLKSSFIFILIFFLSIFALILMVIYSREKEKERILSLYLMLNELKNLIKEGEFDKAIYIYTRIKKAYGEPVSRDVLKNKEKLKEEISKLSLRLKTEVKQIKGESEAKKGAKVLPGTEAQESKGTEKKPKAPPPKEEQKPEGKKEVEEKKPEEEVPKEKKEEKPEKTEEKEETTKEKPKETKEESIEESEEPEEEQKPKKEVSEEKQEPQVEEAKKEEKKEVEKGKKPEETKEPKEEGEEEATEGKLETPKEEIIEEQESKEVEKKEAEEKQEPKAEKPEEEAEEPEAKKEETEEPKEVPKTEEKTREKEETEEKPKQAKPELKKTKVKKSVKKPKAKQKKAEKIKKKEKKGKAKSRKKSKKTKRKEKQNQEKSQKRQKERKSKTKVKKEEANE